MERYVSGQRLLIFVVVAVLGAAFTLTTLINFEVSRHEMRSAIVSSELPLTADTVYSEIQRDLIRPITVSQMMSQDTFLRDWSLGGEHDLAAITKYLKEYQDKNAAFTAYFVSNVSLKYYYPSGILKTVSASDPHDVWFFQVRAMRDDFRIDVDTDQAHANTLTIFINYRVYDYQHNFLGVAGIGLKVDTVRNVLDRYQHVFGRRVYFVDHYGQVMMSGQNLPPFTNIHQIPELGAQAATLLAGGESSVTYLSGRQTHLLDVRFIPELNWYLFVERTEEDAISNIRHALWLNLLISLVATALVGVILGLTIASYQRRLATLATTDSLTGLINRRAWDLLFLHAAKAMNRSGLRLSLVMFDIDHFKAINDRHGHLIGDEVIKQVAARVRHRVRDSDIVCRWGGEELLVLLHNCGAGDAALLAEKVRADIADTSFAAGAIKERITISAGIAEMAPDEEGSSVIARVDLALYAAKNAGRNRIVIAPLPESAA